MLVAIAIPVFTTQLEKSRAATDLANIRSGYAAATSTMLTDGTAAANKVYHLNADGTATETATTAYACKGEAANVSDTSATVGSQTATSIGWETGDGIKYTVNGDATAVTIEKE